MHGRQDLHERRPHPPISYQGVPDRVDALCQRRVDEHPASKEATCSQAARLTDAVHSRAGSLAGINLRAVSCRIGPYVFMGFRIK